MARLSGRGLKAGRNSSRGAQLGTEGWKELIWRGPDTEHIGLLLLTAPQAAYPTQPISAMPGLPRPTVAWCYSVPNQVP